MLVSTYSDLCSTYPMEAIASSLFVFSFIHILLAMFIFSYICICVKLVFFMHKISNRCYHIEYAPNIVSLYNWSLSLSPTYCVHFKKVKKVDFFVLYANLTTLHFRTRFSVLSDKQNLSIIFSLESTQSFPYGYIWK